MSEHFPIPESVRRDLQELADTGGCEIEMQLPNGARIEILPDFDGATYDRPRDHARLGSQLQRVGRLMLDGRWRTLAEIADTTGAPEASVSARLRDLRKDKFGGHVLEAECVQAGLWRYRLVRDEEVAA